MGWDPVSRIRVQGSKRHRIQDPDLQHCIVHTFPSLPCLKFSSTGTKKLLTFVHLSHNLLYKTSNEGSTDNNLIVDCFLW
jgi:hypothetical protein